MITQGSYTSGASDKPLLGITIGDMLDRIAGRYPDNEALVVLHQDVRMTYRELLVEVNRCARALMALGIQKGERVGIWATNRFEWTVTQLATAKMGAVLVNINPAYGTTELEYALRQSGCCALVLIRRFKASDYVSILKAIEPQGLRSIVLLDDEPEDGMLLWDQLMAKSNEVPEPALAERQADLQFDERTARRLARPPPGPSSSTGWPMSASASA